MSFIGPEGKKQLKLAARFASAGLELAITIVVGYLGGRYLDRKLDTAPTIQIAGLVLGIFAGFRTLYRLARDAQKGAPSPAADQDDKPDDPAP